MNFHDRTHAAELLVQKLLKYKNENPLVLGIPRGAVPMAKIVADRLKGDLDVVLVHKIGAPDNPEFAIGSVSEFGTVYRSQAIEFYEIPSEYVDDAARAEVTKLKARRNTYSPIRPPIDPANRTVIIVDDGIATGATMLAAIRAIRTRNPKRIVIAAPVAAPDAVNLLRPEANELVILDTPPQFFAISQFYDEFPQITDEEVIRTLSESGKVRPSKLAA